MRFKSFSKGQLSGPSNPTTRSTSSAPTSSRRRLRRAPPDVNHQGPPNGSVRKSVRTRFSPPLRLVLSTFGSTSTLRRPAPRHRPSRRPRPRPWFLTRTCAAPIPKCPGRLLVRADALVPPAHPQHACGRRDIDKHHFPIATRRGLGGARPRAPFTIALSPLFLNVIESDPPR